MFDLEKFNVGGDYMAYLQLSVDTFDRLCTDEFNNCIKYVTRDELSDYIYDNNIDYNQLKTYGEMIEILRSVLPLPE